MALKRLYVPRALFDDVVDGLGAVMDNQMVGDGLKDGVTMGPLTPQQKRTVETMLGRPPQPVRTLPLRQDRGRR